MVIFNSILELIQKAVKFTNNLYHIYIAYNMMPCIKQFMMIDMMAMGTRVTYIEDAN